MARVVKEEKYAARRNEILDVASKLVYTKGYEQMSIQDILNELKISKGAFYHYFGSKQELLEALIERLIDEAQRILTPIAEEQGLPALEKLRRYFMVAARWKAAQKEYLLSLLSVWYDDNNAIVRQKVFAATAKVIGPMLSDIVRQGVHEGTLTTRFPDQAGQIIFILFQGLSDTFLVDFMFTRKRGHELQEADLTRVRSLFAAYNEAIERLLGAPTGSLTLIDPAILREWFTQAQVNSTGTAGEVAIAETYGPAVNR